MTTRSQPYTPSPVSPPIGLPSVSEVSARAGGENFTVASRLLPALARRHLVAFYGFARLVDEIGDTFAGDRLGALEWAEHETHRAFDAPAGCHPLISAATTSVVELGIEADPLFMLIEANRRDQVVTTYETFDQLVDYCRYSANPVGRLTLAALGCDSATNRKLSDLICTGLQLAEHCQDVAEDARAGRTYIPAEDLRRFGVEASQLTSGRPAGAALRALMVFEVARARRFLDAGGPLIQAVRGRPRLAVAGFWAGGQAALDGIAAEDFDVLSRPPRTRRAAVGRHLQRALRPVRSRSSAPAEVAPA